MYHPIRRTLPAVDLMVVDESTFGKLSDDACETILAEITVRIPSLRHLIALKLHALRSGAVHRFERDLGDVVQLVQLNEIDLAAPDYAQLIERYGTPSLVTEIRRRLAGLEPPSA